MQTQVTFRHFKGHHPELHTTAVELAAGFAKYYDGIISANVEFINDNEKVVSFIVQVQGAILSSTDSSDDFHKSLLSAADKMKSQIIKHKEKH
ncbi:MAG: HPF/RaiA family ribosome-associated protein [Ignavibacteria bacterium]|jgi:ribosomal subunit interface protein|nr:HPF/RaiA family ribosome-associated protein [Ignavibacteria bacterium]